MGHPQLVQTGTELRHEPSRGTCVVAARPLQLGTTVAQERPHATAMLPSTVPTACRQCLANICKSTKGVQACERCHAAHYCSFRCASLDDAGHRHSGECFLFRCEGSLSDAAPPDLRREGLLALRLLHAEGRCSSAAVTDPPLELEEHRGQLLPQLALELQRQHGMDLAHLVSLLARAAAVGHTLKLAALKAEEAKRAAKAAAGAAAAAAAAAGGQPASQAAGGPSPPSSSPSSAGSEQARQAEAEELLVMQLAAGPLGRTGDGAGAAAAAARSPDGSPAGAVGGTAYTAPPPALSSELSQAQLEEGLRGRVEGALCAALVNALEVHLVPPFALALPGAASACTPQAMGLHMLPLAIYRHASRFNHSCRPNTAVHFGAGGQVLLRTVAAVAAAEELCIPYLDLAAPRAARQQELRARYCFDCSCPRCSGGGSGSVADALLSRAGPRSATGAARKDGRHGGESTAAAGTSARAQASTVGPGLGCPQEECAAAEEEVDGSAAQLQLLVAASEAALLEADSPARVAECHAALAAGLGRAVAVGDVGAVHHAALDAYSLLSTAARMCARQAKGDARGGAAAEAAAPAGLVQARGEVHWWCHALCATLASAAAAEALLATGEPLLQHAAACWCDAASSACEALAALLPPASPAAAGAAAASASMVIQLQDAAAAAVASSAAAAGKQQPTPPTWTGAAAPVEEQEHGVMASKRRKVTNGDASAAMGTDPGPDPGRSCRHQQEEDERGAPGDVPRPAQPVPLPTPPLQRQGASVGANGGTAAGDYCAPGALQLLVAQLVRRLHAALLGAHVQPDSRGAVYWSGAVQAWCNSSGSASAGTAAAAESSTAQAAAAGADLLLLLQALGPALAHMLARAQALLRLLLGEAHSACEACQFLPFFAERLPYGVASAIMQLASAVLPRVYQLDRAR